MISSTILTLFICFYIKKKKIEINKSTINRIFLAVIAIAFFPYLYLQSLMLLDKLYCVKVQSNISTQENLNLYQKESYVGEKTKDSYIIYQKDENLEIPLKFIKVTIDESQEDDFTSFQKIDITTESKLAYTSKVAEFLAKDYFYDSIIHKNSDVGEDESSIYDLKLNKKDLLKED